jgi:hypothetical protein
MACKFICDGCGKEVNAIFIHPGGYFKPNSWYQRQDKDGSQEACSRKCIEEIAKKTGKTNVVAPF